MPKKELIQLLEKYPDDSEVFVAADGGYGDILNVVFNDNSIKICSFEGE